MKFLMFIILIFIGLYIKKPRLYNFAIVLFIIFITLNGKNVADIENYKNAYNYIANGAYYSDLGVGWYYICKLGSLLRLPYLQFKTLITLFSYILITYSVKYFIRDDKNNQKKVIWAFYLIFPFFLDCIQVRFLLAEAIVLYATRFLFNNEKKRNIVYYIFCILIASSIHSSVLFYLILLLVKVLKKHESKYIITIVILTLICILGKSYIIKISSLFINELRIKRYFYSKDMLGIKGILIYSIIVASFYYISKLLLSTAKKSKMNINDIIFFENILKINIIMTVLIALSLFDPNFFRLQRISWILLYTGIAKLLSNNIKNINELNISLKLLGFIIAIMGNLIFISITTPEIIKTFLL